MRLCYSFDVTCGRGIRPYMLEGWGLEEEGGGSFGQKQQCREVRVSTTKIMSEVACRTTVPRDAPSWALSPASMTRRRKDLPVPADPVRKHGSRRRTTASYTL